MDIDRYLEPEFDFSRIIQEDFEIARDVTIDELIYVFRNRSTCTEHVGGYPLHESRWYSLGFSQRFRCFELFGKIDDDGDYVVLTFNLLNEYGIRLLWCKKS